MEMEIKLCSICYMNDKDNKFITCNNTKCNTYCCKDCFHQYLNYNENNIILSCYPNPFNQSTLIKFSIESAGNVSIIIYDIIGQKAATIDNEEHKQPGIYTVSFNAENLKAGIYNCVLTTNKNISVQKLIISK